MQARGEGEMYRSGVLSETFGGVLRALTDTRARLGVQQLPPSLLGLPVDLQYLPPDKQREPDADIRKMLIEAIMLVSKGL